MKLGILFFAISCVSVEEPNIEKKAGERYACFNDFYSFLENKSNRADVFPIDRSTIEINNTNFGNLIVLRDEDLIELVVSQRNCKKDPRPCNDAEVVRLNKDFPKNFATGYVFKNEGHHRKFVGSSLNLVSSCLKKAGDLQAAQMFEREAKKL